MKNYKLTVTDTALFEENNCKRCIHNINNELDPCFILGELAYSGESSSVFLHGGNFVCRMKIEKCVELEDIENFDVAISNASEEEINELLEAVEKSWQYENIINRRE